MDCGAQDIKQLGCTRCWVSWVAEELSASKEGLCSVVDAFKHGVLCIRWYLHSTVVCPLPASRRDANCESCQSVSDTPNTLYQHSSAFLNQRYQFNANGDVDISLASIRKKAKPGRVLSASVPSTGAVMCHPYSVSAVRLSCLMFEIVRSAHTLYLCVLCGSQNKQPLFPYTTLSDWFL